MQKKKYLNKKLTKLLSNNDVIFTRNRSITISKEMLNKVFYIYNGKIFFTRLRVTNYLIDFYLKLGEFCSTRKLHVYKKKKKNNKKKSSK
jgi:ribosomal protein S19